MVTDRAETPDATEASTQEEQNITDLTPDGQDSVDTGVVDAAPAAEVTAPTAETDESQAASQVQATPEPQTPLTPEEPQAVPPEQVNQQSFEELRDQVKKQQEQLQYYSQLEQRAQAQQVATQYQQDLQRQGYLPEQAQQLAQAKAEQEQQTQQLKQESENYRLFREGQRNAALHFAKQHKLEIDDLTTLEKFNTPQEMETEAKRMAEMRSMATELAQLKQQQVPVQSFDNNQPSASASGSENDMLDKYIAGDRSEAVTAAARRLMGL